MARAPLAAVPAPAPAPQSLQDRIQHLGRFYGLREVVALFDNEPTHINGYHQAFPDALTVHLATDHSGREVALADIPSVPNFL